MMVGTAAMATHEAIVVKMPEVIIIIISLYVRKSKVQELEKIQLMALRAATGTSPTVSVLCDTSVLEGPVMTGVYTLPEEPENEEGTEDEAEI
nr:unnamed protein product [Callosobruchus chinensis]